jgi:uncharacterized membrane protein YidH (DUF202 family)
MPEEMTPGAVPLDRSTQLAIDRTWVAYERTMLAWVTTATSLITFGFSVYKFFQIIRETPHANGPSNRRAAIRNHIGRYRLGLFGSGELEYRQNIRRLGREFEGRPALPGRRGADFDPGPRGDKPDDLSNMNLLEALRAHALALPNPAKFALAMVIID